MADDVAITAGSGTNIATDDIGGRHFQRVKATFGVDGVADDVTAANPFPVYLRGETTTVPVNNVSAPPVRPVGQDIWTCSFAGSGASVLSADFNAPIVGTGVTYNQTSGSLNILTGTTTNAEFLARSVTSWRGSLRMRASIVASQRIANQNLAIILADLIGEGLAVTINSATSITIAIPGHTFTSQNVGQFVNVGGIVGAAGVPGRYAIASVVAGTSITLTVAGWPASGSCTATVFGWNFVRNLVNGTSATSLAWTTQRRGWADADTTATINSTASPGTIIQNDLNGRDCFLMDSVRATSTGPTFVTRASRYENLPDDDVQLYVFIWSFNGTTAPASTTTWTLGFIAVEKFANFPVYLQGVRSNGAANPLQIAGSVSLTSNTPTLAAGTNLAGDVGFQYRASATGAASFVSVLSPATPAGASIKASSGRLLGWQLQNSSAGLRSVKIFNATSVTPGTTAAQFEIDIPAGGRTEIQLPGGIGFAVGIMWMVTAAKGLTDNTATGLAANDVSGSFFFA